MIICLLAEAFPNVQYVNLEYLDWSDFSAVTQFLARFPHLHCLDLYCPQFTFPPNWYPQIMPPPPLRSLIIRDFDRSAEQPAIEGYAHLFAWIAGAPLLRRVSLHLLSTWFDGKVTPQMIQALEVQQQLEMFLVTVSDFDDYILDGEHMQHEKHSCTACSFLIV